MVKPINKNPCDIFLSDRDYLIHMINHHQVAVVTLTRLVTLVALASLEAIMKLQTVAEDPPVKKERHLFDHAIITQVLIRKKVVVGN